MTKVDLSKNQNKRLVWSLVWYLLVKILPRPISRKSKIFIKLLEVKVHKTVHIYSSVRIYAPWSIEIHEHLCLVPEVNC